MLTIADETNNLPTDPYELFWDQLGMLLHLVDFNTQNIVGEYDDGTSEILGVRYLNQDLTEEEIDVTIYDDGAIEIQMNMKAAGRTGSQSPKLLCTDMDDVVRRIINNYT